MTYARIAFLAWLTAFSVPSSALVFAVNEGVSYRVGSDEIRGRYAAIATDLSKMLGQPVRVEPVGDYKELRKGLAGKTFDLALVHPAHISIAALKDGYKLVAVTKGYTDYRASFLVRTDAPYKSLSDLKGLKVAAPDEDSITAWLVRATVRELMGDAKAVSYSYTHYQDAVPFMVENTFVQAGATASATLVKQWEAGKGRLLGTSKPVPVKHIIASPAVSAAHLAELREYFNTLDSTEAGRRKLEPIKVQGYSAYDEAALIKLGIWLGL
jgi:ABC-type phosphate/phosphonate transport system substrate-binding protein